MMFHHGLNAVLLALFGAVLLGNWMLQPDVARPNVEIVTDMARSVRYNAFEANPVFRDGKTLQLPPDGSIARGFLPLRVGAEEALRAGEALQNPFGRDEEIDRGARLYASFCRPCHGPTGQGDGPVARRGFPPPPSLAAEHARNMKDGQHVHIISFGQGNMPSHRTQISRENRWRIVNYIRFLQDQASPQEAMAP